MRTREPVSAMYWTGPLPKSMFLHIFLSLHRATTPHRYLTGCALLMVLCPFFARATQLFTLGAARGRPVIQIPEDGYWEMTPSGAWEHRAGEPDEPSEIGHYIDVANFALNSFRNGSHFYNTESRGWMDEGRLGGFAPNWLTIDEIRGLFPAPFDEWKLYYNSHYPHFQIEGALSTEQEEVTFLLIFSTHLEVPPENPDRLDLIIQYEYARYTVAGISAYADYYAMVDPRPVFVAHLDFTSYNDAVVSMEDLVTIEPTEIGADPTIEVIEYTDFGQMMRDKLERIAAAIRQGNREELRRWQLSAGIGAMQTPSFGDVSAPPTQKLSALMLLAGLSESGQISYEEYERRRLKIETFYTFTTGEPPPSRMRVTIGGPREFGP